MIVHVQKCIYVEHVEFENAKIMTTQICFMSDVEGDIHYFEKFCENSKIIEQNPEKTEIKFRPGCENCHFVFGGDSQDQGIGDIRFVKMLLDFKEKNQEQVHLIAGNRDVNKMRLKAELYEVEKYFNLKEKGISDLKRNITAVDANKTTLKLTEENGKLCVQVGMNPAMTIEKWERDKTKMTIETRMQSMSAVIPKGTTTTFVVNCNLKKNKEFLDTIEKNVSLLFKDNFPCWLEGNKDALHTIVKEEEFSQISTLIEMKKKYLDWAFTKTLGMHSSFRNRAQELLEFGTTVHQKNILKLVIECIDIQTKIDDYSKAIKENQEASNDLIEKSTDKMTIQRIKRQFGETILSHSIDETNYNEILKLKQEKFGHLYSKNENFDNTDAEMLKRYQAKLVDLRLNQYEQKQILQKKMRLNYQEGVKLIIESFEKECDPTCEEHYTWKTYQIPKNFMLQYLEKADIMHIQDQTVFCHGGITKQNLWKIPTDRPNQSNLTYQHSGATNFKEWKNRLNDWKSQKLTEYRANQGYVQHGGDLAAYGIPPLACVDLHAESGSVLYSNMTNATFNGIPIDDVVKQAMFESNLKIIGTGHQPVGDCALIVRTPYNGVNLFSVTVDNCKSKVREKTTWGVSNRDSKNWHEIIITGNKIRSHGVLAGDNDSFDSNTDDPKIGTSFEENGKIYWIRAKLKSGNKTYYCISTEKFSNDKIKKPYDSIPGPSLCCLPSCVQANSFLPIANQVYMPIILITQ